MISKGLRVKVIIKLNYLAYSGLVCAALLDLIASLEDFDLQFTVNFRVIWIHQFDALFNLLCNLFESVGVAFWNFSFSKVNYSLHIFIVLLICSRYDYSVN